jgi:hypothetical protein
MMSSLVLLRREELIGVIPPPSGVTPNFVDPPSLKNRIVITSIVCSIISAVFVTLRLYATGIIIRTMGMDDCESSYLITSDDDC